LDFNAPFEEFVRRKGYDIPHGTTVGQAHLPDCYDIDPAEASKLVQEFFHAPTFGNLPALEGAVEAVQHLRREGWEFVAITACPEFVHHQRHRNLVHVFGIEFRDVLYSGFGGCKKDILTGFAPSVWVEDNVGHAEIGVGLGYNTFLINQLHNRDKETSATRVDTWAGIKERLCTDD
jgi:hypothetical protein